MGGREPEDEHKVRVFEFILPARFDVGTMWSYQDLSSFMTPPSQVIKEYYKESEEENPEEIDRSIIRLAKARRDEVASSLSGDENTPNQRTAHEEGNKEDDNAPVERRLDFSKRKKAKNWCIAEVMFLVKAHQKASFTHKGVSQKKESFWRSVSNNYLIIKANCFRYNKEDEAYWKPRCKDRDHSQCKCKWKKVQLDLNKFIALLQQDMKREGQMMKSGEVNREDWYSRINKQYVIRNTNQTTKTVGAAFTLYSFKEYLENELINIPKYCMEMYPKFADSAELRGGKAVATPSTNESGSSCSSGKWLRPKGRTAVRVGNYKRKAQEVIDVSSSSDEKEEKKDPFLTLIGESMTSQNTIMSTYFTAQQQIREKENTLNIISKLTELVKMHRLLIRSYMMYQLHH